MSFDVEGAKRAGYSDTEIADHLAQQGNFDVAGARKAGYSDTEILGHLTQPEQPRSAGQELSRQVGLTARHVIEGGAGLAGIAVDPINAIVATATGRQFEPLRETTGRLLTKAGLPEPGSATERVVGGVSRALIGGAGFIGAGGAIPAAAALARFPATQAASAVTGAGSAEVARERGASPGVQFMAGLVGGLATPAAFAGGQAAVRGAFRGGEAGRLTVEDNLRRFNAAGTAPTVGQATEGRATRGAETLLSRVPGGSGPIVDHAEEQARQIGQSVEAAAARLTPASSSERAGMAVQRGIRGAGGFVQTFRANAGRLYDAVDEVIPAQTGIELTQTQRALNELTAPIEGAAATSQTLANPRLLEIAQAVRTDLGNGGTMPYEAVRQLRTRLGQLMTDSSLVTDVPRAQLRQLWGALTGDIRAAAAQNPPALAALTRANNYYQAGMKRLDVIESVVDRNGGPEAVFKAATSGTREGATVLRSVMQSLPHDGQRQVASAVVRRLGRSNPSNQNELGEMFSTERFLTNWNTLSPEARNVLFNRFGPQFRQDMDRISQVAANLREGSKVYANPSGTSQGGAQIALGTTAVVSFLTGNFANVAAVAGAVAGSNVAARLMVNPDFVGWLARTTRLPTSALNAQIQVLSNVATRKKDEDMTRFAAAVRAAGQGPIGGAGPDIAPAQ